MSFLEVLWDLITMWQLWVSLIIVFVSAIVMTNVGNYIANFSPVLALVFGAVGILLTITSVVWIAEKAN